MSPSLARAAFLVGLVTLSLPARGEEPSLQGTWRLTAYVREEVETGAIARPWGERPGGFLTLLPGGRMSMVITAEGRVAVPHGEPGGAEKMEKLFNTMAAYAGTWALDGEQVTFHVDVAWRPEWVGTDQVRQLKREGNRLIMRSTPMKSVTTGKSSAYVLTWERVP
jgi:hypothetical protein